MSLEDNANAPLTVLSLAIAIPPASLLVRLLKVVAVVPPIVWPAPPSNVTVLGAGTRGECARIIGPVAGDVHRTAVASQRGATVNLHVSQGAAAGKCACLNAQQAGHC